MPSDLISNNGVASTSTPRTNLLTMAKGDFLKFANQFSFKGETVGPPAPSRTGLASGKLVAITSNIHPLERTKALGDLFNYPISIPSKTNGTTAKTQRPILKENINLKEEAPPLTSDSIPKPAKASKTTAIIGLSNAPIGVPQENVESVKGHANLAHYAHLEPVNVRTIEKLDLTMDIFAQSTEPKEITRNSRATQQLDTFDVLIPLKAQPAKSISSNLTHPVLVPMKPSVMRPIRIKQLDIRHEETVQVKADLDKPQRLPRISVHPELDHVKPIVNDWKAQRLDNKVNGSAEGNILPETTYPMVRSRRLNPQILATSVAELSKADLKPSDAESEPSIPAKTHTYGTKAISGNPFVIGKRDPRHNLVIPQNVEHTKISSIVSTLPVLAPLRPNVDVGRTQLMEVEVEKDLQRKTRLIKPQPATSTHHVSEDVVKTGQVKIKPGEDVGQKVILDSTTISSYPGTRPGKSRLQGSAGSVVKPAIANEKQIVETPMILAPVKLNSENSKNITASVKQHEENQVPAETPEDRQHEQFSGKVELAMPDSKISVPPTTMPVNVKVSTSRVGRPKTAIENVTVQKIESAKGNTDKLPQKSAVTINLVGHESRTNKIRPITEKSVNNGKASRVDGTHTTQIREHSSTQFVKEMKKPFDNSKDVEALRKLYQLPKEVTNKARNLPSLNGENRKPESTKVDGENPKGMEPRPYSDVTNAIDSQIQKLIDKAIENDPEGTQERDSSDEESEEEKLEEKEEENAVTEKKTYTKKFGERRRKRNAEFSNWFQQKTQEIHVENVANINQYDEEKVSATAMITSHNYIISEPREYQLELFEMAKMGNTIAVLDTGSGKTLIACLLIRHMLNEELEARRQGRHRRVSFFLVDSVTLVFQQAAVLNCNIDANIGKYCGDMGLDLWNKESWDKILDDEQVIVMTADVLYNCLTHSFIRMMDINLLCLDEAHHAKKRHAYARIIKDFYLCEPEDNRPKIFGMTASPVDARVDVVQAAMDLERLLHSRIVTTSDLMLLQSSVNRPMEVIAAYARLKQPWETELCILLHEHLKGVESLNKVFQFAKNSTAELGPWCADQVWKFALSEIESRKIERKEERNLTKQLDQAGLDKIEKDIEKIRKAKETVDNHMFTNPIASLTDLSSKVLLLHQYLSYVYREECNDKCIVFVSRRFTARALYALLSELATPHMKLGVLIGTRTGLVGDENVTFREQMITVSRFRRGKLNCLIATSVAEEGLDIPDCSIIIRFDLYTTMIQYIQSRGRARHSVSKYIHMIEANNAHHRQMIADVRNAESVMRNFCQSLPADRLLNTFEPLDNPDVGKDRIYIEPSTGAKVTYTSAMQIVSHYVGNLPHDPDSPCQPTYVVHPSAGGTYVCELFFPSNAPIAVFDGPPMFTKSGAKRACAFEACVQLRKAGHLNEHLLPPIKLKKIPKMANAHLAVDLHKVNTYFSKVKPSFWSIKNDTAPPVLWVTIFVLQKPEAMGRPLQPICIATREKFPPMPSFPVYSDKGGESNVVLLRLNKPMIATETVLERLNAFTIRLFYDLFNKLFQFDYATIPYWLAPVIPGDFTEDTVADDVLDWKQMVYIMSSLDLQWDETTLIETFLGRFLVDKRQRSRRFVVHGFDPLLTPKDPVPPHGAQAPGIESILDYSYNAGKKGAAKWKCIKWEIPEMECVLIADRVLHRLNYLDPPSEKDINLAINAYICPSAFTVSRIPCQIIYSAMIFPAISTRIDSYLHAWDVCKLLNIEISLDLALEAITKDSDNTHEHGTEQVNVKKGMGNNYERLEFLGDCFLKLATTLSLFTQHHEEDEFQLHVKRMLLICNQHLFDKAKMLNLPEYIQTEGFSRRFWYPAMKLLLGKGTGKELVRSSATHKLGDKSIADVCEALIGAALSDKHLDGAVKMVTALLQTPDHDQQEWNDYYRNYKKPGYQIAKPSASQLKLADDIEKQIGYRFKSARLLMSAFTHSSNPYSWEKVPCYQRLEFLGDALLDLACVRYIFDKHPDADPQWLTEHKMAMVSNKFLGAVSVIMGFHRKLKRVGQHLDVAIREYEIEVMEAKEKSNGSVDFWTSVGAPPKALPDVLEAFIGAIFVDSEFDYSVVEKFFDTYIIPYFVDMSIYDNFAGQHPTTFLTKRMTDLGCENWGFESEQFRDQEEAYVLTAILVHDSVFAYGKGLSIKAARVAASEKALEKLNNTDLEGFYGICNCQHVKQLARVKKQKAEEKGGEDEVIWTEE
ncbi:Dicer-like protein 1 [Rhizina undulata]